MDLGQRSQNLVAEFTREQVFLQQDPAEAEFILYNKASMLCRGPGGGGSAMGAGVCASTAAGLGG